MKQEEVLSLFHNIWVDWVRELLRGCILNSDGTRTIPTNKIKLYTENIMLPAELLDYELTEKNKKRVEKLIEMLTEYIEEEGDQYGE
ncbi:MAG: hypothetical protein DRO67_10520 [Candidatus Asgardarchaeum californiense]|nr:MAG: hypothetical protein DRO67_10520 [Candidatus Asgardarchaeum californiense]